jgi:hypothetical protein
MEPVITAMKLAPDGAILAAATVNGQVSLWKTVDALWGTGASRERTGASLIQMDERTPQGLTGTNAPCFTRKGSKADLEIRHATDASRRRGRGNMMAEEVRTPSRDEKLGYPQ